MRRVSTLILAFGAVDVTAAMHLSAQRPERVSGEVSCAECVISLDTVLSIGGLDGPGMHAVSPFSHVAVDRRGRILVAAEDQAEISVFDPGGSFLRTVGRRGEAPGEYGSISHMVSRTGEVVSYGHDGGRLPSQSTGSMSPGSIVAGADDALWEIGVDENRLVRWELAPEPGVGRVIERHVVEFDRAPPPYVVENFPGSRKSGRNTGAMLDDQGLWIIWHTPDPELTEESLSSGDILSLVVKLSDGWLDLVDPDTGRTIGRHRQDGIFLGFAAGSRYVVAYHETDAGVPFIHLLEPRVFRR